MEDDSPPFPEEGTLSAAEIVGDKYKILREIGRGGMGVVYLAEHKIVGTRVVIKKLYGDAAASRQLNARFETEALAPQKVGHEAFVKILDIGWHNGQRYLVMEYLEGQSLADAMKHLGGPMPLQRLASIVVPVALAMQAAHDKGIIHRDLKPDNIFLTVVQGVEVVRILDLGIAKLTNDPSTSRTQSSALLGTPYFMAPEQCRGARFVVFASDLYALGVIVYYLVTGRYPFYADTPADVIAAHIRDQPPRLLDIIPSLPPRFAEIVHQALSKDPKERQGSMREFAAALGEALGTKPIEARRAPIRTMPGDVSAGALAPPPVAPAARGPVAAAGTPPQAAPADQADDDRSQNARRPTTPMGAPIVRLPPSASASIAGSLARGELSGPNAIPPPRSRAPIIGIVAAALIAIGGGGGVAYRFGLFARHTESSAMATSAPPTNVTETTHPTEVNEPAPPPGAVAATSKEVNPNAQKVEQFRVLLTVEPADAHVSVNGVAQNGTSPLLLEGIPGAVLAVEARKDGYQTWKSPITIADHDEKVTAKLETSPSSHLKSEASPTAHAPTAMARLIVNVHGAWAQCLVDGKPQDQTPCTYRLAPGPHKVVVFNPPLKRREEAKIVLQSNEVKKLDFDWTK